MDVLARLVEWMFSIYWFVLLAGAVVEMVPDVRQYRVARWFIELSAPYLRIFRRNIRPLSIGRMSLDISWMIGAVVYLVIEAGVDTTLAQLLGKY
ncbi:hypothetical protein Alches_11350 [Alicyclobacillus hesperidum subsp. aegles]|uniref:YggT family protein n=1 Tax=Alicyclobacillus hesperidum TaxID=89784 RepID=UPI0022292CCA|nr:YggT family protein [Alicyclobacillus hesperidum]GLG01096.1 hypothetical protein Alches_11350 [Alicyclobacillus hesperidum subsp. aegles]